MKLSKRSHALALSICLSSFFISPAAAIQKSLAGVIDWHKPLVGIPRADIPPAFHSSSNSRSALFVVSDSNVLAALDPLDGSISWRLRLDPKSDVIKGYAEGNSGLLVVSGTTSPTVRLLSSKSGHVVWESPLGSPSSRHSLEKPLIQFTKNGDILLLYEGSFVERLDVKTGDKKWAYDSWTLGHHGLWTMTLVNEDIHLFGMIPSFAGYTLSHISLSPSTGLISDAGVTQIPSKVISPADFLITSNSTAESATVHWLEDGVVKSVEFWENGSLLPKELVWDGEDKSPRTYRGIENIGLGARGYFLALHGEGADIISVKEADKTLAIGRFEKEGACSPSLWDGYVNDQGQAYVTRLFWSCSLGLASLHTYSIDRPDGYLMVGNTFAFRDLDHGIVVDMTSQVHSTAPLEDKYTVVLTTSTGNIQCWRDGKMLWSREESLSQVKALTTVELPERKVEDVRTLLENEGMVARSLRHVQQLKDLPSFLLSFVTRFAGGTYTKALSSTPLSVNALFRDQFGFQKLVVIGTVSGKLFAIDSAHGNVVWSTLLGLSIVRGGQLEIVEMWTVRGLGDVGNPMIAVVAVATEADGGLSTIGYHVDAFSGEIVKQKDEVAGRLPPSGMKLFSGRPAENFALPIKHCTTHVRAIAVVDREMKIHLFPFCKKIKTAFAILATSLSFATITTAGLTGHAVLASKSEDGQFATYPTWNLAIPKDQTIGEVVKPASGPIASFGRVLGDRSALYKYLNPHLIAFSSVDNSAGSGQVYVVDSTTGSIVYQAFVDRVAPGHVIQVTLEENWLVYTYDEMGDSTGGEMGHRLVSVELYEVSKTESLASSTSKGTSDVQTASRSFILPSGVRSLATTSSLHGITTKDLLLVNDKDQVAYIPRRLLDPRRPIGTVSKMDKEEMLVPYEPALMVTPHWTISHNNQLIGVNKIISTPALLESTSLLISYGLDLFGSRVNPSGTFDILSDAFNKTQLVLTIIALIVGIVVAKPTVDRKIMKARWY